MVLMHRSTDCCMVGSGTTTCSRAGVARPAGKAAAAVSAMRAVRTCFPPPQDDHIARDALQRLCAVARGEAARVSGKLPNYKEVRLTPCGGGEGERASVTRFDREWTSAPELITGVRTHTHTLTKYHPSRTATATTENLTSVADHTGVIASHRDREAARPPPNPPSRRAARLQRPYRA